MALCVNNHYVLTTPSIDGTGDDGRQELGCQSAGRLARVGRATKRPGGRLRHSGEVNYQQEEEDEEEGDEEEMEKESEAE